MNLNLSRNVQIFPKCKVCGAGIFLSEEAFIQHFSQNHSILEDTLGSQKSSKENKESEVEHLNDALVEVGISDKISQHKPHLCFLMRNDLYFHVGYAAKINSGSTHNIKFQKTKFSQKNHF